MSVQRWTIKGRDFAHIPSPSGHLVHADDYDALDKQLAAARAEIERLKAALKPQSYRHREDQKWIGRLIGSEVRPAVDRARDFEWRYEAAETSYMEIARALGVDGFECGTSGQRCYPIAELHRSIHELRLAAKESR